MGNDVKGGETSRPFVLYVEEPGGVSAASLTIDHPNKTTAIDIELSIDNAVELIKFIADRLRGDCVTALRVRLRGHLVIE